ncbi:MAG: hypothetical protein JW778_06720 [Candidatus Altiarchaeota archaeon]|nr:hypothetical protein [Candidatus Altiarchaeota archaeon]
MKKLLTILVLLLLVSQAHAIDWEKQRITRQELEQRLFYDFCEDVKAGGKCNVPSPWDEKFWGVCCNSQCNSYTNECSKAGFGGPSLVDVIVNMPCMDKKHGEECELPEEIGRVYDLWGVCCNSQCVYWETQCDDSYQSVWVVDETPKEGDYVKKGGEGPPSPEDIRKSIDYYIIASCIAIKDGEPCSQEVKGRDSRGVEHNIAQEFNLYGVCCSEKCQLKSTECPEETEDTKPDLVIIGMDIHPEDLSKTLQVDNVTITIKNQGAAPTGKSFWIEFMKGDDSSPITKEVPSLGAGEDATVVLDEIPTYQHRSRYRMEALIDLNPNSVKSNLVDESDETNNKATVEVFVGEDMAVCGDGVCDEGEEKTCQRDCMTERFCGDGLCEEIERGSCFEDCGRCGDGNCDEGENESCPEDCENTESKFPVFLFLAFAVVILILALVFFFFSRRKSKGPVIDYELQIKRLLGEKKTIEEMLELAKTKYHRRKLDEESFKEIVKENQKRLIEVETRIKDIEDRMKKLEKK